MPSILIIGGLKDRSKYGNKALGAYVQRRYGIRFILRSRKSRV